MQKFGHTPICHSARDFAVLEHNVRFWTVPKPHEIGLSPSHNHKQTTQHANSSGNLTKPVGHYTTPRCKITRVGGNLPLVAQFWVFCRSGLLITQHSFLFLFLFPLFLPFLLLFSSFLFLSFSFPFLPFSFPFLLLLLATLYELNWNPIYIAFKSAMHVDTWLAMCLICIGLCHAM